MGLQKVLSAASLCTWGNPNRRAMISRPSSSALLGLYSGSELPGCKVGRNVVGWRDSSVSQHRACMPRVAGRTLLSSHARAEQFSDPPL